MTHGHEFLDHPADIQLHAWASSLEELFQSVGIILMRIIVESENINLSAKKEVEITSRDLKSLLFDWLSEILYYFDSEFFVIGSIEIDELSGNDDDGWKIRSTFLGEKFNREIHEPGTEVKAVTYSYMDLEKKDDGLFHLMIIFDI
ncbi:MAG: archease [Promethearchaeota archaeon]